MHPPVLGVGPRGGEDSVGGVVGGRLGGATVEGGEGAPHHRAVVAFKDQYQLAPV